NVGDPSAIGAAGYYYDFDAFDDIQVSTGAHDITVPTGGVFLNMVTKSGGNRWAGRTTIAWEGDKTQSQNITPDLGKYGFLPNTNSVDYVSDVNVSAGGPLELVFGRKPYLPRSGDMFWLCVLSPSH